MHRPIRVQVGGNILRVNAMGPMVKVDEARYDGGKESIRKEEEEKAFLERRFRFISLMQTGTHELPYSL